MSKSYKTHELPDGAHEIVTKHHLFLKHRDEFYSDLAFYGVSSVDDRLYKLYKFCESLPSKDFKWFRVNIGLQGTVMVKLFPCGTKWVRVTDLTGEEKRRKSIVIETLCQACVEHGEAITQEAFEANLLKVLEEIRGASLGS